MARQKTNVHSTVIALLLPVLAGCSSSLDQIKARGATALGCKVEQVTAETLPDSNYIVRGCGKSVGYACKDNPDGTVGCHEANANDVWAQAKELREIRILKGDLPAGCTDLGPIQVGETGPLRVPVDYDVLYAEFKGHVLKLGGNFGRLDAQDSSMLRGVAFRCPPVAK
jgi:hypothetical protein